MQDDVPHRARALAISRSVREVTQTPRILEQGYALVVVEFLHAPREVEQEAKLHVGAEEEVLPGMADPVVGERAPGDGILRRLAARPGEYLADSLLLQRWANRPLPGKQVIDEQGLCAEYDELGVGTDLLLELFNERPLAHLWRLDDVLVERREVCRGPSRLVLEEKGAVLDQAAIAPLRDRLVNRLTPVLAIPSHAPFLSKRSAQDGELSRANPGAERGLSEREPGGKRKRDERVPKVVQSDALSSWGPWPFR